MLTFLAKQHLIETKKSIIRRLEIAYRIIMNAISTAIMEHKILLVFPMEEEPGNNGIYWDSDNKSKALGVQW